MKRIFSVFLLLAILLAMPLSVFAAEDVRQSLRETYDDEETGLTIPYRLIVPEIYDPKYEFSLVVFFHGAGERGMENENQLKNCVQQIANNMPKSIILVPQCSHMGQWVDTPWGDGCYSVDEVPESDEMIAVMNLIEQITQEYTGIDRDTIYAAGISMGGFAVWDAMVRHNDVFAAGIAVCGAGDPSKAEILKDTPMFVFHGDMDDTVPVSGSADMVAAIEAVGGTKVQYEEMEGLGHGIWNQVFQRKALYDELKKCKLSDREIAKQDDLITTDPEINGENTNPSKTPIQELLPWIVIGCVGLATMIVVAIILKGKKGKKDAAQS